MSGKNRRRLITIGLIVALGVVFGLSTEYFFTSRNIFLLLRESAFTGLIALGVVCVMVGGGVDLSAGGVACFVGVVVARASQIPGIPGIIVIIIAVAVGMACGMLNGLIVTKLYLSEFVTTLATGFVFAGLALLTTFRENGRMTTVLLTNKSFLEFGKNISGLYFISIVWIVCAIIMQFVFTKTKLGLYISAMGSNPKAAQMSAINVTKIKIAGFIFSGGFSALAATFVVAFQTTSTLTLGSGMEFQAIAACVVGGVILGGGKGDALSAVLGAVFMTLIQNGLYKWGLSTGGFTMLQGIIIVLITNFDTLLGYLGKKSVTSEAIARKEAAGDG